MDLHYMRPKTDRNLSVSGSTHKHFCLCTTLTTTVTILLCDLTFPLVHIVISVTGRLVTVQAESSRSTKLLKVSALEESQS